MKLQQYQKIETELKDQILSKYFTFRGNVATLRLVYDTFAELVNLNFGDEKIEKLNDKLFSDIREAIEILPKKYRLKVEIAIKDFGAYSREECEKIILQNVKLSIYLTLKTMWGHRLSGLASVGLGAAILLISYFLSTKASGLIFDVVNIAGTLFVWEGVSTAFLGRRQELKAMRRLVKALENVVVTKEKKSY